MAPNQSEPDPGVKVVFVLSKDCPPKTTTFSICTAAEKVYGVSCYGAQERAGLWRISTLTAVGRIRLLASRIELGGKLIEVLDKNPFLREGVEDDDPSTKLSIDDLPMDFSNIEVDRHLQSMGIKCRTKVIRECDKDPESGKLSDYRTGKRTVWINLPDKPLPRSCMIGKYRASLFHWEMKREIKCRKCLGEGHKAADCKKAEVCFVCRLPGHRKGDPICEGKQNEPPTVQSDHSDSNSGESEKCAKCLLKGHQMGSYRCKYYEQYCTDCTENGHLKGDRNCDLYFLRKEAGENGVINDPLRRPLQKCSVCGSTEHQDGSLDCKGNFPELGRGGNHKLTCKKCGETGHEEGNILCLFRGDDKQDLSENKQVLQESFETYKVVANDQRGSELNPITLGEEQDKQSETPEGEQKNGTVEQETKAVEKEDSPDAQTLEEEKDKVSQNTIEKQTDPAQTADKDQNESGKTKLFLMSKNAISVSSDPLSPGKMKTPTHQSKMDDSDSPVEPLSSKRLKMSSTPEPVGAGADESMELEPKS